MGQTATSLERGAHLVGRYLELNVSELGVTQAEAHVLGRLAATGTAAMAALHREFGRKRSTLTNIVDRLEERGFLVRDLNPADRRSFVLRLTPSGRAAARRVSRTLDALERDLVSLAGPDALAAVDAVVDALERVVRGSLESGVRRARRSP
jgi:DNA-binding MarR family transcriptional regulator